jgi:hypothetical protein
VRDDLPIRIPLAGSAADGFFVRQKDDYSCGPACLATVARIYGIEGDYAFYRDAAQPDPKVGTPETRMAALSEQLLPSFTKAGCDSYEGGIAIANIIQEEDHYVVFLKKEDDRAIYYDPWEHELVIDKMENIAWLSQKGTHDRWCIDFAPIADNSIERWVDMALPKAAPQLRVPPPGPRL